MMATDHDRIGRALDELRGDVVDVPLASPGQVRARGEQRARRQRAALGAGTVVAVAAIAVGASALPTSLQSGGRTPVPPAGSTPAASRTTSAAPSSSPSATRSTPAGPRQVIDVTPVGVGDVPSAYFLAGNLWTGPDFVHGAKVHSIEPKEFEGSVGRFMCDPDTEVTGDVRFVQAARADGTIAGTQKVRILADAGAATGYVVDMTSALPRCQERLREQAKRDAGQLAPGETAPTPTAEVTEDGSARVDDATGSVRLYRTITDYGTGAGSRLVEWVALAREGSAVTLISLNQFEEGEVSFAALQRIAVEARTQMAWAASRG
jgi:hypothetical protein